MATAMQPAGARQPVSAMLASVSNLSTYLANPDNLRRIYQSLNDRQRLLCALIDRANSQRGIPTLSPIDRLIKVRDWEPILKQVPTYALDECFNRAVTVHTGDRPFGAPDVLKMWRDLPIDVRCTLLKNQGDGPEQGEIPLCDYCGGYGFKRVQRVSATEAIDVAWENRDIDTNDVVRCHCRASR